jgi:arylsulfatase A-like enzyme
VRILHIDIDSLRPDHLGCYGYARATSPHIDQIAQQSIRFDNVYASDVPCLPSRAAFFSGRFGIHTGVINHGGAQAEMWHEGKARGFGSLLGRTAFVRGLRDLGFHTATVSSFAERHAAYFFAAGWNEMLNPGRRGLEIADEVEALARGWLDRHARNDGWFLHVQLWDPHTPYRAPAAFGDPFAAAPLPAWLTEAVRAAHFEGCGPHSARETIGYDDRPPPGLPWSYPRQPLAIDSPAAVRRMFDGYDTGVLYADRCVGQLLAILEEAGVLADTAILVTADHGENLGELNVYGDHQTADQATARLPMLLRWPALGTTAAPRVDRALHYQVDVAATVLELLGGRVPPSWDGRSFAPALRAGAEQGRDWLVISQAAWTAQRAVRFQQAGADYLCIRTYHDGYHGYPDTMLFDLATDPHEQNDLQAARPAVVNEALARLERWLAEMMTTATHPADPMWMVLHEGGPKHVRGELPAYLQRLRATGRAHWADLLAARHPKELG